jgi:hypothetical protein
LFTQDQKSTGSVALQKKRGRYLSSLAIRIFSQCLVLFAKTPFCTSSPQLFCPHAADSYGTRLYLYVMWPTRRYICGHAFLVVSWEYWYAGRQKPKLQRTLASKKVRIGMGQIKSGARETRQWAIPRFMLCG